MYQIGNKVIYPMHGVGVISSIEEKEFSGEKKQYYTINLLNTNMNIMIPSDSISTSKVRLINDLPTLQELLSDLNDEDLNSMDQLPQKQRYQINMEKMKSGDLKEGLELVRDLTYINHQKPLNTNEMQMLNTTRKFILDEIAEIKHISEDEANEWLFTQIG